MSKKTSETSVWLPPGFNAKKSYALQAVMRGEADAQAQKDAISYIRDDLCGMCRPPEDLESQSATYYNLGRQVIGRALDQIFKLNLGKITEMESK